MKKLVSLFLAAVLALSLAAVPNVLAEDYDFQIVVQRSPFDKSEGYGTKLGAVEAEKKTGIKIEYYEVDSALVADRVSIMLASGTLPDAFINTVNQNQVLRNLPLFTPLDEYLTEDNCPHVMDIFEKYPNVKENITQTDGHIYSLPTSVYTSPEDDGSSIQFINKAWLDKLNLEMPTTTEEFYNVCKAVKDGDPNGNGLKDEIPVLFSQNNWCGLFIYFMHPWGISGPMNGGGGGYLKIDEGKVIFTPTLPEFRAGLEYWHRFAEEGLLDVEGFTMTNQQYYARLKEDICLSYRGWTPSSNLDTEKAAEFVVLKPLQASDYPEIKPVQPGYEGFYCANNFGFAITAACKDPAKLVQWYDAQNADTKTKMTWRLGEEGALWELQDGVVYELWPESATVDFTRENMKHTYGCHGHAPVFVLPNEISQYHDDAPADATVRRKMVETVKPYLQKEIFPQRPVDSAKLEERGIIFTDLKAYLDSFVADCVVHGVDDAKWEKHLKDCQTYHADEWTQWYQDFREGKFKERGMKERGGGGFFGGQKNLLPRPPKKADWGGAGRKNPACFSPGKYGSACWSRALKKADWRREGSKKKTICFSPGERGERPAERSSGEG